jgi:hypothetical protein
MKQWQFTYSFLGLLFPTLRIAAALAALRHPSNNFVLGSVSGIFAVLRVMLGHSRRNLIAAPSLAGWKEF